MDGDPQQAAVGIGAVQLAGTDNGRQPYGDDVALAWRADDVARHISRDDVAVRVALGAGVDRHVIDRRSSADRSSGLIVCSTPSRSANAVPWGDANSIDEAQVGPVQLNQRSPARCGAYQPSPGTGPRR